MVTYISGEVEQSPPFLTSAQQEEALTYLVDNWSGQRMEQAQREAWLEVLSLLRHGELKPALAVVGGRYRPDPYTVLEAVQAARPSVRQEHKPPPKVENVVPIEPAVRARRFDLLRQLLVTPQDQHAPLLQELCA
jgi:hypothetical protein